ncbi:hypothetical protein [Candidatus Methylacidithermus pantelleriae]|uniref:Uncharacterized protein n=1 Tax=Candidatus Methylacidithermus pantelleriae TaxID=2744239 RepID=A0A8J2BSZ1_9BACT|nr:hypothetical protein [Candidatus Methylacidithermus pantelleriae]CAF0698014.1 hypothetical protein MPNT_240014 [Candidatus Methylacidithermus pantelleriae]
MTLFGKRETEEIRAAKALLEAENEELKRVRSSLEAELQRLQQELAELKRQAIEGEEGLGGARTAESSEELLRQLEEENIGLKEEIEKLQAALEERDQEAGSLGGLPPIPLQEFDSWLGEQFRGLQQAHEEAITELKNWWDSQYRELRALLTEAREQFEKEREARLELEKKWVASSSGEGLQEALVAKVEEQLKELTEACRRLEERLPQTSSGDLSDWFSWGGKWWRKSQIVSFTEYQSQVTSINGEAVRSGLSTEALLAALAEKRSSYAGSSSSAS